MSKRKAREEPEAAELRAGPHCVWTGELAKASRVDRLCPSRTYSGELAGEEDEALRKSVAESEVDQANTFKPFDRI